MNLKAYLESRRIEIENFLEVYYREPFEPAILYESMRYSLLAGGKRIRPILCLTAYETCGGKISDILAQASAIELIHTYSLIHDDLPAMDDDKLRRGKPTNHVIYGEAMAILAGDGLLTDAFRLFSKSDLISGDLLIRGINILSANAGIYGMVAGQALDIVSEGKDGDKETVEFIHQSKTAALIKASLIIGGILSGADSRYVGALSEYGENIGLAFQVTDDILDITGTTEELGKPKGSDDKKNKMTYPAIYGVEKSRLIAGECVNNAKNAISVFEEKAHWLLEIADYLLTRTK